MRTATIERIVLRRSANGPPVDVDAVEAVAGRGLEGDRYWAGTGTFSVPGKTGQDLTLIAAEALEATGVTAEEAGRNVVVRGLPDLEELLGSTFALGPLTLFADRPCDPCATLARRTRPDVLRDLAGRGGIRCDIVAGGHLAVGDPLVREPGSR